MKKLSLISSRKGKMREKGQNKVTKTLETPVFSRCIEISTEKLEFVRDKNEYI